MLDLKGQMMIDDYDARLGLLQTVRDRAVHAVRQTLEGNGVAVALVESRIKKRDSLIGKLVRKGHKYASIRDITDLIGIRIVTNFCDDVDRVASFMEQLFEVDWNESIDKRKMHQTSSFGYNSLHYICRLPMDLCADRPDYHEVRFEIQMRSTLQHAWSNLDHDIGYKSQIETPEEYKRMLGRLAGMLELVDEEFSRLRISVADYRRRMEALISEGKLSEVTLDGDTFERYLSQRPFDKLARRIAAINCGEVVDTSFAPFFPLLVEAGMKTLGDVDNLIRENEEDAFKFAMSQFASTDIDIIASTVALQDLLIVHTLKTGGGKPGVKRIFDALNGTSSHNDALAEMACSQAAKLPFMNL